MDHVEINIKALYPDVKKDGMCSYCNRFSRYGAYHLCRWCVDHRLLFGILPNLERGWNPQPATTIPEPEEREE